MLYNIIMTYLLHKSEKIFFRRKIENTFNPNFSVYKKSVSILGFALILISIY